jgi:hypothetical protein
MVGLIVLVNIIVLFGIWCLIVLFFFDRLVPHCIMWTVWCERNSCIFEDEDHSLDKLGELFFGHLFDWARVWGFTSEVSLTDFVVSLSFSKSPIAAPV